MLPHLSNEHGGNIEEPALFFHALGNLHDAKVQILEWNPVRREVALVLDDLYSNFVGLPEHVAAQPVRLILGGVSKLEIAATADKFPMRIVDFEVEVVSESEIHAFVNVGPTGFIRIMCNSILGQPE